MAKITPFPQKDNKDEKKGQARPVRSKRTDSLKERILRHRLSIIYRTALVLVILAGIVMFVVTQMKNRVYTEFVIVQDAVRTANDSATVLQLGESSLLYSHDGASCLNSRGESVWNQTYEMQDPIVAISGREAAIADRNGHYIYVMSETGIQGTVDTGMPIKGLAVSAGGVVSAVLDDSENVTWIYLFDTQGKTLAYFKTTMRKSGYPMNVAISDNGTLVCVSYLYMDNTIMKTSVAFFNFGPVGQNEIDNFVSSYDYVDCVMPYVTFMGNKRAVAVGDSRIAFYEGDQKPISILENLLDGEIRSVYMGGEHVALVYHDVTGEALYKIDVYNGKGNLVDTIKTDMQFLDMVFTRGKLVIYNSQECIIHTVGGVDNFRGNFPHQVIRLIPQGSGRDFMAITSGSVELLRLT